MARPRKFDRDSLLEIALQVFWEKGYEATSVQHLCDRMGIHPGSLFGTFGDKQALFYEALNRYEERARERLFQVFDDPVPRREALTRLFAGTISFLLTERASGRRGCFMVNSLVELCPLDPAMDTRAQINLERLEGRLASCLEAAIEKGEIRALTAGEIRERARALMASLLAIRVLARVGASEEVLQDVARAALRTLED